MTTTKCFKRKYKKLKARFDAVTHTQRTITEKQISCNSLAARLTSETYYILDLLGDITPVIDTPPYPDLDTRIELGEGRSGGSTGGTIGIGGIGGIEIDDYWRTASPPHFHDLNFDDPEPSQTTAVPPLLKKRTPSSRTPGPNSITQGIDDSYAERTPVSKREREDKDGGGGGSGMGGGGSRSRKMSSKKRAAALAGEYEEPDLSSARKKKRT